MENSPGWEQKTLINELARGKELAKQLQNNLTSSSHETCELLIHNILNSYDKALSMLKWNGSVAGEPQLTGAAMGITSESPSLCGSPHSEDSDRDFKDHEHKDGSRKRVRRGGHNKCKFAPGQDLKDHLMMAIVGENMDRKTFLEPNIQGIGRANPLYDYSFDDIIEY
ncbi:hypothetical protein CsSME_00029319 [Camellia sinensis var. sinensis]